MNEIRNLDTRSQLEQNIRHSVFRFTRIHFLFTWRR